MNGTVPVFSYFPKSRVQTENGTCTYDVKGFYSYTITLLYVSSS